MFLAHKGYSLSSMEEFDNLPDSYFSPKEWEKFLKLRGNEMWINMNNVFITIEQPKLIRNIRV